MKEKIRQMIVTKGAFKGRYFVELSTYALIDIAQQAAAKESQAAFKILRDRYKGSEAKATLARKKTNRANSGEYSNAHQEQMIESCSISAMRGTEDATGWATIVSPYLLIPSLDKRCCDLSTDEKMEYLAHTFYGPSVKAAIENQMGFIHATVT